MMQMVTEQRGAKEMEKSRYGRDEVKASALDQSIWLFRASLRCHPRGAC